MNSTEYLAKMIAELQIVEQLTESRIPRGVIMYLTVPQRDVVVEALKRHVQGAPVTDAMVERAWAAIVGRDIAPQCFNASIIRADLRTGLEAAFTSTECGGAK